MGIFLPEFQIDRVVEITPEFLAAQGIRALLLDVDNTLTLHGNPEPFPGVREWLAEMKVAGMPLFILSNAMGRRVSKLAARLGLDYIAFSMKPLPFGYFRARRRLGIEYKEIAIVGDQLFTDILGGKLCGLRTILVKPTHAEPGFSFRIRRRLENRLLRSGSGRSGGSGDRSTSGPSGSGDRSTSRPSGSGDRSTSRPSGVGSDEAKSDLMERNISDNEENTGD